MMNLRICDGGREHVVPASLESVERAFAPDVQIADGTEIAVADGARWLAALAVHAPGEPEKFLLSGEIGPAEAVSGRVDRAAARQRFRDFIAASLEH